MEIKIEMEFDRSNRKDDEMSNLCMKKLRSVCKLFGLEETEDANEGINFFKTSFSD